MRIVYLDRDGIHGSISIMNSKYDEASDVSGSDMRKLKVTNALDVTSKYKMFECIAHLSESMTKSILLQVPNDWNIVIGDIASIDGIRLKTVVDLDIIMYDGESQVKPMHILSLSILPFIPTKYRNLLDKKEYTMYLSKAIRKFCNRKVS